jgi:hypothetical protein
LSFSNEEISSYVVEYYGAGKTQYRAIIALYRADKSPMGAAYFHRGPATMPSWDSKDDKGNVSCNYFSEDFPRVIDLLRNEKPVCLRYWPPTPTGIGGRAMIATGFEPVGESELTT